MLIRVPSVNRMIFQHPFYKILNFKLFFQQNTFITTHMSVVNSPMQQYANNYSSNAVVHFSY